MENLPLDILIALALDLLIGDPQWRFHPVRLVGRAAGLAETVARRLLRSERAAGIVAWTAVIFVSVVPALGMLLLAGRLHPLAGDLVAVLLIYFSIAPRDLATHAGRVRRALAQGDLPAARDRVGFLVARDTSLLDESGVARATVESVAENIVDGVTAPLVFAAVLGPAGAFLYRAVNTMDSMFGYKNDRYKEFGRLAARADDAFGYIPARITGLLTCVAALFAGGSPVGAFRIMLRDSRKHPSPNAGITESAVAGALGIRLGGPGVYFGKEVDKPYLGDPGADVGVGHIRRAVGIMIAVSILTAAVSAVVVAAVRSIGR